MSSLPLPHLPRGACVLLWDEQGHRLLTVTRRNSTRRCWPGGKVERGETPVQAASRELEEETGVQAKDLQFVANGVCGPNEEGQWFWVEVFQARVNSPEPMVCEPGILPAWLTPAELLQSAQFPEFVRKVIRHLEEHGIGRAQKS